MIRHSVYVSILFILFVGCDSYRRKSDIKNFNWNYRTTLAFFDSSLVSFLPDAIHALPARQVGYVHGSFEFFRFNGIILEVSYSDSLAQNLRDKKHLISYSSQDSNLLIVGRLGESTPMRYQKFETSNPWINSSNDIPVPNFYNHNYPEGTYLMDKDPLNNRLPEGYILYVENASPGIFIREDWLTEGLGLPAKWRNGYSRGYAISSDTTKNIIYWLAIW